MAAASSRVVRGPQQSITGVAPANGNGPKTPAQRAKDYRANQKKKIAATETRAAWATMSQPGGALPVQTTEPDDKGDPARWSSVPEVTPAPPDPHAAPVTNADGTVTQPVTPTGPQPVVTKGVKRPPTEQEQASADKLGEKLARFWEAGGEIAKLLYEENVKNNPEAPTVMKVWAGVLVKEWLDKDTRKMVKAAGAQLAIDWGIATTLAPPPAVIVIGAVALSGGMHLIGMAADKEKAAAKPGGSSSPPIDAQSTERPADFAGSAPIDDEEQPSDRPYAQSWSEFGSIPKGAKS